MPSRSRQELLSDLWRVAPRATDPLHLSATSSVWPRTPIALRKGQILAKEEDYNVRDRLTQKTDGQQGRLVLGTASR